MTIDPSFARHFLIVDAKLGHTSMFLECSPISGVFFPPLPDLDKLHSMEELETLTRINRWKWPTVSVAQRIALTVTNVDSEAHEFLAALWGKAQFPGKEYLSLLKGLADDLPEQKNMLADGSHIEET